MNVITTSQWDIIEQYGALFLPTYNNQFEEDNYRGTYWSASNIQSNQSLSLYFSPSSLGKSPLYRFDRNAVRLVRDVE